MLTHYVVSVQLFLFEFFIGHMVEWADLYAHRTTVVVMEIRETFIVINIGDLSTLMPDRFMIDGFSRTLFDTQPAGSTIICDPGVLIALIERQVFNAGVQGRQSHTRSIFRCDDQAAVS